MTKTLVYCPKCKETHDLSEAVIMREEVGKVIDYCCKNDYPEVGRVLKQKLGIKEKKLR